MNGTNIKKVLLFGLLGCLGCIAGWLLGELFLLACLPSSREAGTTLASKPELPALKGGSTTATPPPAPPPITNPLSAPPAAQPPLLVAGKPVTPAPPPPEFAARLEKAGAKTGDVQITLIWFNGNDLDLHCVEPSGFHIFFASRRSRTGGELDVDMNAGGAMSLTPVENIYWPKGKAPTGKYRVSVHHYANHGGPDPTAYKVSVLAGGKRQEFSGAIRARETHAICEFEVGKAEPEFQVAVSPEVVVYPGGKNVLTARVARGGFVGPVSLRFDGDLRGIAAKDFAMGAGESDTSVELAAEAAAPLGERLVTVHATAGALTSARTFRLVVKESPPSLALAVSPELIVPKGGTNWLPVRVARAGFVGPVAVSLEGDWKGVIPKSLEIAADKDEGLLEMRADTREPGDRTLRVSARAGFLLAEAKVRIAVTEIPPALRVAVPRKMVVDVGGKNRLPVRILREGFSGPVAVRFSGDLSQLTVPAFSILADQTEGEVEIAASGEARDGARDIVVIAEGSGLAADATMELHVAILTVTPGWSWALVLVIGFWTTLLALGLALALVIGQNWYLGRPLLAPAEFALVFAGALGVGIVAGGIGQTLYGLLTLARLVPEIGFLAGWLLLGALLGRGLAFFIPNLSGWRATAAGCGGGLVGATAFLAVSAIGDVAGRFMGAAILGFAIGLMVALVEMVSRKLWLNVVYGPDQVRSVNLGAMPVVIGGDGRKCTVQVAGAPGMALKFWEKDGEVHCLDVLAEKTCTVTPGYRRSVKQVEVVVCSNDRRGRMPPASSPRMPAPPSRPSPAAPAKAPPARVTPVASLAPTPPAAAPMAVAPAPAVAAVTGTCPVCGVAANGAPGKRRCPECFSMF